jgi:hypothetical protein
LGTGAGLPVLYVREIMLEPMGWEINTVAVGFTDGLSFLWLLGGGFVAIVDSVNRSRGLWRVYGQT